MRSGLVILMHRFSSPHGLTAAHALLNSRGIWHPLHVLSRCLELCSKSSQEPTQMDISLLLIYTPYGMQHGLPKGRSCKLCCLLCH
jgi:hypothetical protein